MISFGIFIIKFVFLKQNYICLFLWLPFIVCFKFGNVVRVFLNFGFQRVLIDTPYCWLLYIYHSLPIHFLFDCRHLSIEHVRDHILLVWKILAPPLFSKHSHLTFENYGTEKIQWCRNWVFARRIPSKGCNSRKEGMFFMNFCFYLWFN